MHLFADMIVDIQLDAAIANPSLKRLIFQEDRLSAKTVQKSISSTGECFSFSILLNVRKVFDLYKIMNHNTTNSTPEKLRYPFIIRYIMTNAPNRFTNSRNQFCKMPKKFDNIAKVQT